MVVTHSSLGSFLCTVRVFTTPAPTPAVCVCVCECVCVYVCVTLRWIGVPLRICPPSPTLPPPSAHNNNPTPTSVLHTHTHTHPHTHTPPFNVQLLTLKHNCPFETEMGVLRGSSMIVAYYRICLDISHSIQCLFANGRSAPIFPCLINLKGGGRR